MMRFHRNRNLYFQQAFEYLQSIQAEEVFLGVLGSRKDRLKPEQITLTPLSWTLMSLISLLSHKVFDSVPKMR